MLLTEGKKTFQRRHKTTYETSVLSLTKFVITSVIISIKGQLILKCPFGILKSPKKTTKFFPGFLP